MQPCCCSDLGEGGAAAAMKLACPICSFWRCAHTHTHSYATRMARSDARKRFTPLHVASSAPPLLALSTSPSCAQPASSMRTWT